MTKQFRLLGAASAVSITLSHGHALAQQTDQFDSAQTDVIMVTALADDSVTTQSEEPPEQIALPADTAAIAARVPGGAGVGNGALSGQLSYRGLFGERVLGTVNGQRFSSGGPNAMDPPLHYAPSILVERISIARGVAPVSQGPSLAGAVDAQLVQARFAEGPGTDVQARMGAQYRTVDNSYAVGGLLGIASEDWRLGVIASREEGDDYAFPGGTAVGTSFARSLYGVHGGVKLGEGELFAEYRRSETDPTGNPPFAMDIVYFDTDFVQAGYRGQLADDIGLSLRVGHVAVRHLMDNQTLRQPPAPNARATFADADTTTGDVALRIGSARRNVSFGGDFELVDKYVQITNPMNADFFLEAQPGLASERFGGFVQARAAAGAAEFELGARIDRVTQLAGIAALGSAVPMGPRNLANQFSATGRAATDTTFDALLRAWLPGEVLTPRLTLARKTRVPSLLERFAWLPTEASYGLADGNIYVGNQALEPEVAWIAEAGVDIDNGWLSLRPTVFYRAVDNYIQGTPFDDTVGVIDSPVEMVANMNGDPTPLMFRNVDAALYGADLDFTLRAGQHLFFDGTASLVRGQRRDSDDNLYRIPPASLRLAAVWQQGDWSFGTELDAAADADKVSLTNSELPSDGYVVVGLFGSYAVSPNITLTAGVENLFDSYYQPHLAGRSRVGESDVVTGERLPGTGRGAWLRLRFGF